MAEDDVRGVVIGTREIYDAVVTIKSDVRSLVEADIVVLDKLNDHEGRLRDLERWRWSLPAALVTGLLGAAGTVAAVLKATGVV